MHRRLFKLLLLLVSPLVFSPVSTASPVVTPLPQAGSGTGGSFTVEFWVQALTASTPGSTPSYGAIILDRHTVRNGNFGDFGISVTQTGERTIAFSVSTSAGAISLGSADLYGSQWQHIAVTRNASSGEFGVLVNGAADPRRVSSAANPAFAPAVNQSAASSAAQLQNMRIANAVVFTSDYVPPASANPFAFAAKPIQPTTVAAYRFQRSNRADVLSLNYDPFGRPIPMDAPEPGSFWLFGFGAALGIWWIRGRR